MNKEDNPDIVPVRTKASPKPTPKAAQRPQVLDLRPGHIRAVAAMKEQEAKRAARLAAAKSNTRVTTVRSATKSTTPRVAKATKTTAVPSATNNKPGKPIQPSAGRTSSKPALSSQPSKQPTLTTPSGDKPKGKKKAGFKPDRIARKVRKQLDKTTVKVVNHGKKFIINRWDHVRLARRNVILWLSLILLLIVGSFAQTIYYGSLDTTVTAVSGGTYAEGTTDKLTTISPLHASTNTEKAASQLVYPGLLSYDDTNKLHGDLAQSWSVDDSGSTWTITLKDGLLWSDGQTISADDVVYTVELMQNDGISSTLASTWQDIDVSAKDDRTVQFTLPSPLASFDTTLTFGVLPQRALSDKSAVELASLFNGSSDETVPGAGPFILDNVESTANYNIWHFSPNDHYYGGTPELDELTIRTYLDNDSMLTGLRRGEINAASDVPIDSVSQLSDEFKIVQLKTTIVNNQLATAPYVRPCASD